MISRREIRTILIIWVWSLIVHARSLSIWFDWETVRFFVQPRPGRFRWLSVWIGSWIDLSDYGIRAASLTFRPLMATLFQMEALLFGSTAWGYHLKNLSVHLLCTALLLLFCRRIGLSMRASAVAALLFTTHPLTTQPMWILGDRGEQFVLLGGLFALVMIGRHTLWALAGLLLALLSKETAVTIPVWLLVYDVLFIRESTPHPWVALFRRQWPFWAMLLAYLPYRGWALGGIGGYRSVHHFALGDLLGIIKWNLAWLATWPAPSSLFLIPAAAAFLPLLAFRRFPRWTFAMVWITLFLLPVHNLCNKWYLYTPVAAMALLGGVVVNGLTVRNRNTGRLAFSATCAISILFSLQSTAELRFQKNNADIPLRLSRSFYRLHPDPLEAEHICFFLPRDISLDSLRGHWLNPSKFQVKSSKSATESIVWDLNATRFLSDGTPIWTRSVEAAFRLLYDDIRLKVTLGDFRDSSHAASGCINVFYDPVRRKITVGNRSCALP